MPKRFVHTAHLSYQSSLGAKKHLYQDASKYLNFETENTSKLEECKYVEISAEIMYKNVNSETRNYS